ncbi:unnamed protein product, partial [Ectocarpus sp. 4 AP-2014]
MCFKGVVTAHQTCAAHSPSITSVNQTGRIQRRVKTRQHVSTSLHTGRLSWPQDDVVSPSLRQVKCHQQDTHQARAAFLINRETVELSIGSTKKVTTKNTTCVFIYHHEKGAFCERPKETNMLSLLST